MKGLNGDSPKEILSISEISQSKKQHSDQTTPSKIQESVVFESCCWFGDATARECEIAGTRSPKVLDALDIASQASRIGGKETLEKLCSNCIYSPPKSRQVGPCSSNICRSAPCMGTATVGCTEQRFVTPGIEGIQCFVDTLFAFRLARGLRFAHGHREASNDLW